jgi:hypothetical protein
MKTPQNAFEATVLALSLALTAQTEEQVTECVDIAASLGLTKEEMDRAKVEAYDQVSASYKNTEMWSEENDQS